jgi:hypothetical protein
VAIGERKPLASTMNRASYRLPSVPMMVTPSPARSTFSTR